MKRMPILMIAMLLASLPLQVSGGQYTSPESSAQASFSGSEESLRVFVGRSLVVRSPEPIRRVSVTDPEVASAAIVDPNQLLVHGLKLGTITLLLWDEQERLRSFDLQVQLDLRPISTKLRDVFPEGQIEVSQSGGSLVLTGEVASQEEADRAAALAATVTAPVVNMLQIQEEPEQAVMLQVKFAEVDRSAIQDLGVNIFSAGAANTIGSTSTQQFGGTLANVGAVQSEVTRGKDPEAPSLAAGGIGRSLAHTPAVFGLGDLLNIFIFRPDLNLGAVVRALQQRNLLQILAEPNLLAMSGKEASFLAGGEFPFPMVQAGTNVNSVTILFKEFGVRLKFTANVLDEGLIRLKVAPEVSSLDFANALTISGFLVPALSTRRTDTEVELRDGQSFAIAGLLDQRLTEVASKIPWLGDVPILGKLFRSRAANQNKTELMVMVTPRIVKALEPGQTPPTPAFPLPFLDTEKFDGRLGATPPSTGDEPPKKKSERN